MVHKNILLTFVTFSILFLFIVVDVNACYLDQSTQYYSDSTCSTPVNAYGLMKDLTGGCTEGIFFSNKVYYLTLLGVCEYPGFGGEGWTPYPGSDGAICKVRWYWDCSGSFSGKYDVTEEKCVSCVGSTQTKAVKCGTSDDLTVKCESACGANSGCDDKTPGTSWCDGYTLNTCDSNCVYSSGCVKGSCGAGCCSAADCSDKTGYTKSCNSNYQCAYTETCSHVCSSAGYSANSECSSTNPCSSYPYCGASKYYSNCAYISAGDCDCSVLCSASGPKCYCHYETTCSGTTPYCVASNGCVQCTQDSHCSSQTCDAASGFPNRKKYCQLSTHTCECGKCGSNSDCASGYCCEDDNSGPKTTSGQCYGAAPKIFSNTKWLCATSSPTSWHECNNEHIGETYDSGGKSYVCLSENGEYSWGETSSANLFVIALAILFFLAVLLKKNLYRKLRAPTKKKSKIKQSRR